MSKFKLTFDKCCKSKPETESPLETPRDAPMCSGTKMRILKISGFTNLEFKILGF